MVAEMTVPAATTIVESPWTPALIAALFAGLGTVITALTGMFVALYTLRRTQKSDTVKVAQIDAKVDRVHSLIDGGESTRMERELQYASRVAELTGDPTDALAAAHVAHELETKKADIQKADQQLAAATAAAEAVNRRQT